MVVVSNGVTHWKMDDVRVKLRPENEDPILRVSNDDGAAFFSFDYEHKGQKFYLDIQKDHYDSVHLTRYVRSHHRETQVIHVEIYPRKLVRLHVGLGSHHYHQVPAIGAVVDWTADDDGEIVGVGGHGIAEINLSGKSETIHELTVSVPWQTTCGSSKYGDRPQNKEIYGAVKLKHQQFSLSHRPPYEEDKYLTLPKLDKIHYDVHLHDFVPKNAELHTDLMRHDETLKIEDAIRHDKVSFQVDIGATEAYLFLEEPYSSKIVVTPLDPCFSLDSDSWEHHLDGIRLDRSVYHKTAKVVVKMVDKHLQPISNASLHYILGETAFGHRFIHADKEDGEVHFHLPEDMLVHISTQDDFNGGGHSHHHSRNKGHPDNPTYFVARDGLVLHLMFGEGASRYLPASVALIGEGFQVPEGTMVRYVAKDWAGDEELRGVRLAKYDGSVDIEFTLDSAYLDFSIGGSDGFDPVFFQPFEYVYNVSQHHHETVNWDEPLEIEIPVKSIKNVIVSAKDCFNGEVIDERVFVEFPSDSFVPHSWYDRHTMPNRYSAFADDQVKCSTKCFYFLSILQKHTRDAFLLC